MKMKWTLSLVGVGILAACQGEIPQEFVDSQMVEEAELSEEDEFAAALSGEASDLEEEEVAVSESGQEALQVIHGLHKTLRLATATCAGFGDEAQALIDRKDELKEQGLTRQEIHAEIGDEKKALKEAMMEQKESFRTCRQEGKDSEEGVALKAIIDACFDKPERSKYGIGRRGPKGPKGRRGPRKPLPPLKFADFDSAECQQAVADAENLIPTN